MPFSARRIYAMVIASVVLISSAGLINASDDLNGSKRSAWKKIKAFFSPPEAFRNSYGAFRSPLTFYDGHTVKSKKEWPMRRKEILDQWNSMLGAWPPLIKGQHFTITDSVRRENLWQYRISFEWIPGMRTQGYLLIPDGEGKRPAVITVYYEPETAIGAGKMPDRDFAYQLARRGFVTLSLGTTEGTKAETWSLYYPDITNANVQPLSMLACAAANAWETLSLISQVDSARIGIMGHSYGGKWAMFASCLYDKFACAVWSDPGIVFNDADDMSNYWEPWYLGYHPQPWRKRGLMTEQNPGKGLYKELTRKGFDLTDLHALMAPRPFLVSGGSVDLPKQWSALNHSIDVNRMLGQKNRVAMTNRPAHSPDSISNDQAYTFLEYFLK